MSLRDVLDTLPPQKINRKTSLVAFRLGTYATYVTFSLKFVFCGYLNITGVYRKILHGIHSSASVCVDLDIYILGEIMLNDLKDQEYSGCI